MPTTPAPARSTRVVRNGMGAANLSLRVLGMAVLLLTLVTGIAPMASQPALRSPLPAVGLGLLAATLVATGATLLVGPKGRWPAWFLTAPVVLASVMMAPHRMALQPIDLWVPGYWMLPVLAVALVTLPRREYAALGVVSAVSLLLADAAGLALGGWTPTRFTLADNVFIPFPMATVLLFGDALREIIQARDRSVERQMGAQLARERHEAEAQARREAARMLHDHVLHALHALARAQPGEPARMAVEECRTAYDAMTRAPRAEVARVEQLLVRDPGLHVAGGRVEGLTEPVPSAVAEAVAAAVHEALNNVTRHARVDECVVVVAQHDGQLRVDVVDHGAGFDTSRLPTGRLGMGRSIVERMDDIGGQATTTSAPGRGTTVALRWPRELDAADDEWQGAPHARMRRALTRTAWPALAVGIVMTILVGPALHPSAPMMLVSAITMAGGLWAAKVLASRPLVSLGDWLLVLGALAAWLANLWFVPPGSPSVYLLWMAWGSSALVHLLVLSARQWVGVGVGLAWFVVQSATLVARYGTGGELWRMSSAVTSGAGEVLITLLALAIARRMAAQDAAAARVDARMRVATARLQLSSQWDQYWSARVTAEALPLLRRVAAGEVAPEDPQVRERARTMEVALRDELVLGPSRAELVADFGRARAAGWSLTSTLSPDDGDVALGRARELLAVLGDPAAPGQVVTLSATGRRTTALVIGADEHQVARWRTRLEAIGGGLDVDPDFVRLGLPA